MPDQPTTLIKNDAVTSDARVLLRQVPETGLPAGPVIVPLEYWQAHRDALRERGDVGVWLASDQPPAAIGEDLDWIPVVAIDFPVFTDGRGFSYGRTLRERYRYAGEVRAIGQFIQDQLHYLRRCGFDAFALETADPAAALASLKVFSESYQASVDQPLPWFRRRA
jgi:uncharacterized protein (DUF934 family)